MMYLRSASSALSAESTSWNCRSSPQSETTEPTDDSTASLAIATGERASEAEAEDSAAVKETGTKPNFNPSLFEERGFCLRQLQRKGYNKIQMSRKFKKIIIFLVAITAIFGLYFAMRSDKKRDTDEESPVPLSKIKIEEPKPEENSNQPEKIEPAEEEQIAPQIPEKFLLEIPFYSQAPLSKWDAFHEDMCEEASVLNGALYLLGKKLTKDQFEAELQKMQKAEKKEVGEWKSTTIAQLKKVSDIYFGGEIKSKIIDNPTVDDIEAEIADGNPVVVPLAGRDIGNPNFTPPGPIYHMLTVKGYDNQNFITNDVGTRKGDSYTYKKEVIMKNMHDWNEKDIHLGEKRILVLYK